jgi:hypothetical protein
MRTSFTQFFSFVKFITLSESHLTNFFEEVILISTYGKHFVARCQGGYDDTVEFVIHTQDIGNISLDVNAEWHATWWCYWLPISKYVYILSLLECQH